MGKQAATLLGIQLIDIHGSKFYDLTFALDSKPDAPKTSRIGTESVYADPQVGDKIRVSLLLGQLVSVEKSS
jgi:hypothetical protein